MAAQAKQTNSKVEPLHHVLRAHVSRLAKSLGTHGTEAQSVLSVLVTIQDWWEKDDAYQCTVLAPEGGEDSGVCVLILDQYEVKRLLLYAPEGEATRFLKCLEETTLIPWDSVNMLCRIIKRLIDPVEKILEAKGFKLYGGSWNNYLVMSPQDVLALEEPKLPNNVSLRALTEADASLMVEKWRYAQVDGIPFTRDGIKYNGGIGAVDKDGNLIAWVEWNIFGVVGHLFVLPSHRRLGLAAILTILMSKEIAKTGRIVAAEVDPNNDASLNVFKRLGFQYDHINRYRKVSRAR